MATSEPVAKPTKVTKYIQRKSAVTLPKTTGNIVDTLNVEDKITNAPSINLVQMMAGVPEEGVIEFDGDEIPEGYEEVIDAYSTEEQFTGKYWRDGKKIYKRTLTGVLGTSSPVVQTVSNNIDKFVFSFGFLFASYPTPINTYWDDSLKSLIQQHGTNKNQISIYFGTAFNNVSYEITVFYTKTID